MHCIYPVTCAKCGMTAAWYDYEPLVKTIPRCYACTVKEVAAKWQPPSFADDPRYDYPARIVPISQRQR